MQHMKFIAWNKRKVWKPKQYEITATLQPHNTYYRRKFTASYHSFTTLLPQKFCSCSYIHVQHQHHVLYSINYL